MAKIKNDYFKMIEEQVACCLEASDYLQEILSSFPSKNFPEQREKMHEIEHRADVLHHGILRKLSTEFITPIDQEDILRLVQIIDDITDALDEIVLEFHMFHIKELPEDALALSEIVHRCIAALLEAAAELKNFKKPQKLHDLLVKVNDIEGEADAIYIEAIHKLFGSDADSRVLFGNKAMYESLERCCDLCEHAADVIEQVIIKNT